MSEHDKQPSLLRTSPDISNIYHPWTVSEQQGTVIYQNSELVVVRKEDFFSDADNIYGEYCIRDRISGLPNYKAGYLRRGDDILLTDISLWEYKLRDSNPPSSATFESESTVISLYDNSLTVLSKSVIVGHGQFIESTTALPIFSPQTIADRAFIPAVQEQMKNILGKKHTVSLYKRKNNS